MDAIREKLEDTSIGETFAHVKHSLGKLGNYFNPNHRHDEPHEQSTDRKRTAIAESHRYKSFAPQRSGNKVKWYVDGRDYFWAVSEALDRAKETIYIADWWLSPELFLRRPPARNQEWRLDQILKRRAEAGVKIYVAVYKEVTQALTCNSAHTKHALMNLCPEGSPGHGNIHVIRHPDHNPFENLADVTLYWAHHEKFIVIDYEIAFIGGLDLCFGRYDIHEHPLADAHPGDLDEDVWPGQDFNNSRIMDFKNVDDWLNNELSKTEYARMPWHDVAVGLMGPCVYDIAEHFVLRWNCIKRDKYKREENVDWLLLEGRTGEDEDLIGVQRPDYPAGDYIQHPLSPLDTKPLDHQGTVHGQLVRSSADWSSGILTECSIQNAYSEIIRNAQHYVYMENQFFITATGDQQDPVHNQIGRAIVDAVVRAAREGRKFRIIVIIPAIPGFAGDLRDDAAKGTRAIMDYQYRSILRGEHSIFEQISAQGVNPRDYIFFFNLRSYDRINKTAALVEQEERAGVRYNDLQRALAEKVMSEGVHPSIGDDGEEGEKSYEAGEGEREKYLERWRKFEEYRDRERQLVSSDSIAKDAMLSGVKVSEEPWEDDPETEKENFVQEELYVHSKLLIADDRIVICGSANLNDRSQLGDHDSELAIVLEDRDMVDSTMDGEPYRAARFAATLRRHLWREHLGLLPPQGVDASDDPNARPPDVCGNVEDDPYSEEARLVEDPLSDELWSQWTTQATTNTDIFRELFRADPDDNIKTFEDYDKFTPREGRLQGHIHDPYRPVEDVRRKLDEIRGHLVWMPLEFLREAEMAEPGLTVNGLTESIYT